MYRSLHSAIDPPTLRTFSSFARRSDLTELKLGDVYAKSSGWSAAST